VTHTREFADSPPDAHEFVQRVVHESLVSGTSRFFFVNFVHLGLGCIVFASANKGLGGGVGTMTMAAPVLGPAGAFGLFAGLDEFLAFKKLLK
jgi:hypothetical protein